MDYVSHYLSPLGGITLASDGEALTGLWFDDQRYYAAALRAEHKAQMLPVFEQAACWLDVYFCGLCPDFTPPLRLRGSPFRRAVWEVLLTVPYGQTVTYGQLARALGDGASSARAVGGAVAHNPISLIVPCHRVLGVDGRLTGYAGGLERKRRLLALEAAGEAEH